MTPALLSWLIFLPMGAAGLLWLLPARHARLLAMLSMLASMSLAVAALAAYDPAGARFQLLERAGWIASLNVHYLVGVDGLSILFLPATALLFLGSLVACWNAVQDAPRFHYSLLLVLQAATFGIFCALDTVLFFVFWELTLVPLYFLLGRWGVTAGAAAAATRYFLIMLASGIPLLLAFVIVAASQTVPTFDLTVQLAAPLSRATQTAVFLLCLVGFGVKVPLVPLHTWLPQFALAAPGSLTALLVGLKLGAFGLIRFAVPLAPEAALDMHWLLAGLGTVAVLYGAVGMLAQSNMRVSLAYASVCHVGLAVLGLSAYTAQGAQGAVSLLLSFSVATGGAFLLLEFLRQRTGATDIHALGGAAKTMPLLASGFLICGSGRGRHARNQQFPRRVHAHHCHLADPHRRRHGGPVRAVHSGGGLPFALSQGLFRAGGQCKRGAGQRPQAARMGCAGGAGCHDRQHRPLSRTVDRGYQPGRRSLGGRAGPLKIRPSSRTPS